MKIHNFSAGPSILPKEVMQKASQAVKELDDSGLSLIEISHRSKNFVDIMDEACDKALNITKLKGKGYKALFLQGGASQQFLMSAYNLLEKKAGFINSGTWSTKAIKEAQLLGEVIEVASSKDKNFNYIPKTNSIPADLDYLHLTTNNTIFGTQFKEIPETSVPLVADMSSDIFSTNFDYSKFSLFYAGAQKNLGPAGTTLVIVKEDILGKVSRQIPSILDYSIQIKSGSMFNTPPVFSVYTCLLTLRWIEDNGGLDEIGKKNKIKADLIYEEIDKNSKFVGFADKDSRSTMNATFNLSEPSLSDSFDTLCQKAGISGIKGHRSVGGYRASMYNALSISSVKTLVECMQILEQKSK